MKRSVMRHTVRCGGWLPRWRRGGRWGLQRIEDVTDFVLPMRRVSYTLKAGSSIKMLAEEICRSQNGDGGIFGQCE